MNELARRTRQGSRRTTPAQLLLTLRQAAEETGVPYSSLRDLVLRGYLSSVRLGNSRRIWLRRADLERLVQGEV